MDLESARNLLRGILVLGATAFAYWVDSGAGLAFLALMGTLILQSSFTRWCPADFFLRRIGLKRTPAGKIV